MSSWLRKLLTVWSCPEIVVLRWCRRWVFVSSCTWGPC